MHPIKADFTNETKIYSIIFVFHISLATTSAAAKQSTTLMANYIKKILFLDNNNHATISIKADKKNFLQLIGHNDKYLHQRRRQVCNPKQM